MKSRQPPADTWQFYIDLCHLWFRPYIDAYGMLKSLNLGTLISHPHPFNSHILSKSLFDYSNRFWFGLWFQQTIHLFITVSSNPNQTIETIPQDVFDGFSKMEAPPRIPPGEWEYCSRMRSVESFPLRASPHDNVITGLAYHLVVWDSARE